jgi:PAS domain S-box-containing protein
MYAPISELSRYWRFFLFWRGLRRPEVIQMAENQTYEKLKQNLKKLEKEATKGKRAKKTLERKITELDSFINNIPDMAWIKDATSRFIAVNSAFGRAVGMVPESLIHQTCEVCFGKEEAKKFQEDDLKVMKGGRQQVIEEKIIDSQNNELWLETVKSPILDHSGRAIGTVGISRNITKRKRAEETLRQAHDELERIVKKRTADLEKANEQLRLEIEERKQKNEFYLDSNVKDILGYSDSEIPNELDVWSDYVHPEDKQSVMETFQDHIDGKTPEFIFEHRMIHKDGSARWIMARGTALRDAQGNTIRVVGTDADITERKQVEEEKKKLEEQVQQAQRLEAIGTLAGGIAHDFNNLLMAIQGNTSLLLYNLDSSHPHFDALENIEKAIRSGAKLTKQLLGYARKGKYQVTLVKLNQLVEEVADAISRTRKEIIIHRELSEDLFAIEAEQGQIEQVLLNLYINAADSMPSGGKMIIKTLNVTHEDMRSKHYVPKPGNYVKLTVTDTGIGMDKRTQERIFEPFFTTKEMGRGTGLGLASVYGIVKSHGGYIEIESEKGHGTTFTIFLPGCSKEIPKTIESSERIIEGSGTILLVDDEEMVLETGVKMLERLGYNVLKAGSGIEAVEVYKDNKEAIDLVILDMIMPGMGGGETYDKMKKINPIVKVLLSSGYSSEGQAAEILKRGCKGFIQKPFDLQKLSGKVLETLVNQ